MVKQERTPKSNNNRTEEEEKEIANRYEPGAGLNAKSLIHCKPQHHGEVLKLHIPLLYSVLPFFVQRFILKWSSLFALFGLVPTWKKRYLILCGSFVYKFRDVSSSIPKGSPFDVETTSTDVIRINNTNNKNLLYTPLQIDRLPIGYEGLFVVSTFRKRHYYAVTNTEEALVWSRCTNEARQETITRNMGHANVPYPSSWKYFDTLGNSLVKSKIRIQNRERQHSQIVRNEMEMTEFITSSGGYHG